MCNIPRVTSLYGSVMRELFGVDHENGRTQFAFDFSSLEARIQGHYVLPYPYGEDLAQSLVADKPNDCFDMNTQILTRQGWKYYKELTEDTLIANWHEDKTITYNKAHNFVYRKTDNNKMISIVTDRINIRVTDNHRINLYDATNNKFIIILAGDLKDHLTDNSNTEYRVPASGISYVEDKFDIPLDSIEMVCDKLSCVVYKSYDKEAIMSIITNERLRGSSSFLIAKERNGKTLYQTSVGKQPLNVEGFKLTCEDITIEEDANEYVWCVSVPSERVIIRRNDCISITMNCHCLPSTNKVLTKDRGWVTFTELQEGEPIAQWSDGLISYEVPDEIIIQPNAKPLYNFSNKANVSMTVTPNHRVVLKHIASGKYVTKLAEEVKDLVGTQAYTIPLTALNSNPDLDLTDDFLKLLVAVQADGYFDTQGYCRLKFSKQRKIDRLTDILNSLNISPTLYKNEREGTSSFTLSKDTTNQLKIYLRDDKSFKDSLLHMSTRQANIFINEVQYWDGTLSPNSNIIYDVHDKVSRDFLHTLSSINGISSTANECIKPNPFKPGEFRTIYRFLVSSSFLKPRNQNNPAKLNSIVFNEVEGVEEIACVSIKSSYFLCKEGDRIFVTGNSINAINLWGDINKRGDAKSFGYA